MNEGVRMFFVLTGVTAICALLLGGAHELTRAPIEMQKIRHVKGPAIRAALGPVDNDPLAARLTVNFEKGPLTLFPGKKRDSVVSVAIETSAQGYGGEINVITAFDLQSGVCRAVAVSHSSETPGIGSRATQPQFTDQFRRLGPDQCAALRADGGTIDAVSGATVSSRALCSAVARAQALFTSVKSTLAKGSP